MTTRKAKTIHPSARRKTLTMAQMKRLPHEEQLAIAREHIAKMPNYALVKQIEREAARKERHSYKRDIEMYEAMYEYARKFGPVIHDPEREIKDKSPLARALNAKI